MKTLKKLVSSLLVFSMIVSMFLAVTAAESVSYSNCVDANGNPLNVKLVNGVQWVEENGELKMPAGHMSSFLLFDNTLANKRIEATIYPNDLHGSADDRNGLVFALTDEDGDSSFSLGSTDASYYWVFITGWGSIEVAEMGKYQNWSWISKTQPTLASLGIDPAEGVTLAVEWDDEGHIRVFANDILVHNLVDATPLTGDLYGMLVRKWGNSGDPGTENYPYDAPVTSFVAGGESLWDKLEKYTITASTTPQWGGTVIGAGEYAIGSNAILTAMPKEGYVFEGWYENGELVSSSAAFTFTVEANRDLTAKFTAGYIYGDVSGDAQINMKDLVLIRKYIANFNFDTNTSSINVGVGADANGDGQINMEDVVLIRKSIINHNYDAESETYALQDITDSLKLHGRTSLTADGIVCDHSATGIEFSAYIEGAVELTVTVSADTYFTVYIDGVRQATRYNVKNGTATLTIANFMEGGVHNIRVLKQTESANSLSILKSISFKGQFEEAPAEKDLFIEFLGDSITCGYGNLCANGAEGAGSAFNEDATQTYAYLAAQKLGADHSLVSCSGIGVTSSWSGNFVMKDFFSAQSYHRSTGVNYEKTFTPDIVVINLGTNDSSKGSDGAQFKEDAKALIALVRSTYGEDVKIVWAANMMGPCMQTYSQAAINELGGEAAGLYFCTLTENRDGGGAHPSNEAHASAATDLANFIQENILSK